MLRTVLAIVMLGIACAYCAAAGLYWLLGSNAMAFAFVCYGASAIALWYEGGL